MARDVLSAEAEVESLRDSVAKHFEVYGVLVTPLALTFQIRAPAAGIDGPFDALRQELVPKDYIPTITQERGEILVHVQRRPKARFAGVQVNLILLIVTVLTILFFGGAWNWADYSGKPILSAESIGYGAAFFSVPLLAILGCHEMGHYVVAKRYHVRASLPFAGWVGLFVTAINLLPAGQLDGGHVARALLGRRQFYISWAAVLILFGLSAFYPGWFIFGFLILMLGVRHPPPLNDISRLDPSRMLVGIVAVVILLVTFVPQPFVAVGNERALRFEDLSGSVLSEYPNVTIALNSSRLLVFAVNNTGPARENVVVSVRPNNLDRFGFVIRFTAYEIGGTNVSVNRDTVEFRLNASHGAILDLEVTAPLTWGKPLPETVTFQVHAATPDGVATPADLDVPVQVTS